MYYRKANAAMLVFDITSVDSFGDMKTWVNGKSSNSNFLKYFYLYPSLQSYTVPMKGNIWLKMDNI